MSRLIDADELMKNIDEQLASHDGLDMFDKETVYLIGVNDVASYIVTAPTVDAVEVVRCKECIYYKEKGYDSRPYCYYFDEPWSPSRGISREPDDYCSRGERKAE